MHSDFLISLYVRLLLSALVFNAWLQKWEKKWSGEEAPVFKSSEVASARAVRHVHRWLPTSVSAPSWSEAAISGQNTDFWHLEERILLAHRGSHKLSARSPAAPPAPTWAGGVTRVVLTELVEIDQNEPPFTIQTFLWKLQAFIRFQSFNRLYQIVCQYCTCFGWETNS